jgi:hypothetical protein
MSDQVPDVVTGLCDSHGTPIVIGDLVRKNTDCNQDLHGEWTDYRVSLRGMVPVLLYVRSQKGQILPGGYTGKPLSECYDPKNFMFVIDVGSLRPREALVIIQEEKT